jgi:DNA mismatch endonuclease, patch repair protein
MNKIEHNVAILLNQLGFLNRYKFNDYTLPGRPDFTIADCKALIFVNGCYWHRHQRKGCANGSKISRKNSAYWEEEFLRIQERDKQNRATLVNEKWRLLTLWECDLGDSVLAKGLIRKFLVSQSNVG